MNDEYRRLLAGPSVLVTFALLVVPLVVGTLKTALMTPLALPGYLVLTIGSAVGNLLFPQLALWLYWVPFALASYAISVVVGIGYRSVR
jgi:hypothetical protein